MRTNPTGFRTMRTLLLLSLTLLAACGTTQSSVTYTPTVTVAPADARGTVEVAPGVSNQRQTGREDPTWIGTIRGGYGNPIRALNADRPIDQVVGQAFAEGLAARGLAPRAGAPSRYSLAITIHAFDANQYVRREATADFSAVLTERATGREIWRDRHRAYQVDGSLLSLSTGVFANVEDLRAVAMRTMSEAVDVLLDKPQFRAALRR
jgi:hypothetical protein